jgi:hypothetical protein
LNQWIDLQQREGVAVPMGNFTLTPVSKVFIIQYPGLRGGLIWNRPAAVRIAYPDGTGKTIPIRDVTLITLFGIAALSVVTAILASFLIGKDKK